MTSASIKFLTSRAHVLGDSSHSLDREMAFVRTCARLRWRAHGSITPGLNRARNPASHQSAIGYPFDGVIATVSSHGWRKLRTAFERTRTHARAVRLFSRGQRLICELVRTNPKASGRLSSLRTLVKFCQEPASGLRILFSPLHSAEPLFLGLVALSDGHRDSKRKLVNVRIGVGEIQNVIR